MKTSYRIILLVLVAAGSFFMGSLVAHWGSNNKAKVERQILYYVDPMNPAFKSAKPGIAPCGMALEPVYADGQPAAGASVPAAMPPGTIRIYPEKQQVIGIKIAAVEKAPWNHTLRVLGRITPDETRVYRINAAVAGMIKKALPVTTGSLVKENELLATFYSSQEYRALVQSYFNSIKLSKSGASWKTDTESSQFSKAQLAQMRKAARELGQAAETSQIDYYRRNILNSGIGAYQLAEMERTGTIPEEIEIRSPAAGFVVLRNVTADLRFDKGAELYRIADISRIWVLADVFENEASFFQPGRRVKMELPYQKKILYARMSNVLPQFDPATRTLKIRLEADNPGYALRPDMFVNVEIPVSGSPAILVPADAVIDSGLKKTVFVDRGNGYFEPRQVETGRSLGERVEITRGLMPGEKIVVSGNFLIDSESRMQQVSSGISGKAGRDVVCGMNIDEDRAQAAGLTKEYQGQAYFFCSPECRDEFGKTPQRYAQPSRAPGSMPPSGMKANSKTDHSAHAHTTMKSGNRPAARAALPDHAGMNHAGHGAGRPPTAELDSPSMPMEKTNDMNSAMPRDVMQTGPAALTSPLPMEKTNGMNNAAPVDQPPAITSPGKGPVTPGMPGAPSLPPPAPGALPDSFGAPIPKAPGGPGPGYVPSIPQTTGITSMTGPKSEGADPATGLPQRKINKRQFPRIIAPRAPANFPLPGSGKNKMISPGGDSAVTEPHMKTTDDGQNHD